MQIYPVKLETNRLLLYGLTPGDMDIVFNLMPKDQIKQFLGHNTDEEFEQESLKQRNGYATYNRTFLLFMLKEKSSDRVIGRCGLHNWNIDHQRAEIGYNISLEAYKKQGYMTEAVSAILSYGFKSLQLHRIEALVGSLNTPSLKIMKRFGFVREGLLRQHYNVNGKYEDSVIFSILESEYPHRS